METWKKNLENVISQWENKGLPPAYLFESGTADRKNDSFNTDERSRRPPQRTGRRRRQLRNKEQDAWKTNESIASSKFRLLNPVLKAPRQAYTSKACSICEKHYKSIDDTKACDIPSNLFNVLDVVAYSRRKQIRNVLIPDISFAFSRMSHYYPAITLQNICSSKRVSKIIAKKNENEGNNASSKNSFVTVSSLHKQIAANISNSFLRFATWILLKFFKKVFSNICCQTEDLNAIKLASKKDVPIIYLPLHKTHLDYFIISFILFCNDIRVPYTAAGDNLSGSSLFGYLLHKLGAFFIRRKNVDENGGSCNLYHSVLQEYIEQLLKNKQSIQIFIEGTRSRTGKPCMPKTGILSIITNAVIEGCIDDVMIVPVNISYEKIAEVGAYSAELLGAKKVPESIWQLIPSLYRLMTSFNGQIHVRFGRPKSFEAFKEAEKYFPHNNEITEAQGPNGCNSSFDVDESTLKTTKFLANHVINDCCSNGVIVATSMVCFLLATKYRSGVAVEELEESFDWLREKIEHFNGYLGFIGLTRDVVPYAIQLLIDQGLVIVTSEDNNHLISPRSYIKPCEDLEKVLSLVFYSNQVASLFAAEAIVAISVIGTMGGATVVQMRHTSADAVSRNEILSFAKKLCNLLIREHNVFLPCKDIDTTLSDILDSFVACGLLDGITSVPCDEFKKYAARMADWDITEEGDEWFDADKDIQYKVNTTDQNRSRLIHLNSIMAPLLETYWFVAASLHEMLGAKHVEESTFVKSLHSLALERVRKGLTQYAETASLATIKNAVAIFLGMGVISRHDDDHDGQRNISVSREFLEPERFHSFLHEISLFR